MIAPENTSSPAKSYLFGSRARAKFGAFALSGLLALSLQFTPAPVSAEPSSHEAAALELIGAMKMESLQDEGMQQVLGMMIQQNPSMAPMRDTVLTFLRKYIGWSAIKDDFVRLYTKSFSEKELKEIAAFYRTPAGKKSIEVIPRMMEEGMQIASSRLQAHQSELEAMLQEAAQKPGPTKQKPGPRLTP